MSSIQSSCDCSDIPNGMDFDGAIQVDTNDVTNTNNVESQPLSGNGIIGSKETNSVRRGRTIVSTLLVISAISAGFFYWSLNQLEYKKFTSTFDDDSSKLSQSLFANVMNTLAAIDLLSTDLVSHATQLTSSSTVSTVSTSLNINETWPFVTLPNFGNIASKVLSMSGAVAINSVMLVNGTLQRRKWEAYAWEQSQLTINQAMLLMETDANYYGNVPWNSSIQYVLHDDYNPLLYEDRLYAPVWQMYPLETGLATINWDWMTDELAHQIIISFETKRSLLGEPYILPDPNIPEDVEDAEYWANIFSGSVVQGDNPMEPVSDILYPVVNSLEKIQLVSNSNSVDDNTTTSTEDEDDVVALITATFYWRDVLKNALPPGKKGLHIVIDNPCTVSFTYQVDGPRATYLGRGDLHDRKYTAMGERISFFDLDKYSTIKSRYTGIPINDEYCTFSTTIYPSTTMEDAFVSYNPLIVASVSFLIFVLTSIGFLIYDTKVERRQKAIMTTAVRSTTMLSSLFPANVCDQLLEEESVTNDNTRSVKKTASARYFFGGNVNSSIAGLGQMFSTAMIGDPGSRHQDGDNPSSSHSKITTSIKFSQPIADLYPETTVLFADISGFTVWSSSRGPDQVFHLLESLYSEFDSIARKRKVFKVETIGDTYVAVAGLPEPMQNHATVMVRFAEDMLQRMDEVVYELSTRLGPDTADLKMRVGLNSGPTTAGVIRGEKSRFQLFGDTVNTASRMESNGKPGCIQCSPKTADLLRDAGKDHWLTQRLDVVQVKGKGEMITYWVQTAKPMCINFFEEPLYSVGAVDEFETIDKKGCSPINNTSFFPQRSTLSPVNLRLIEWNLDIFTVLIQEVASFHQERDKAISNKTNLKRSSVDNIIGDRNNNVPLDEVVALLDLQDITSISHLKFDCISLSRLDPQITQQLFEFLKSIALLYNDNPFHNFDHACHVVMSTKNLLNTVKTSTDNGLKQGFFIDPISRFAIVFGALIHDVGHLGVPNSQLIKENACNATKYRNRCVAEQNSFDVAWTLFMQPQYTALRKCLFVQEGDFQHFRQVTLNIVMATDIFDKDLTRVRQTQWDQVFEEVSTDLECVDHLCEHNLKATICIEHLIQASDVIHTMQHWHVYQKWNHNLFVEMCVAYKHGRLEKDPCLGWYEGELWFFDNYVIPLAKKLKRCNVFGANSDAFLDFARDNRTEWAAKGKHIVQEWTHDVTNGVLISPTQQL